MPVKPLGNMDRHLRRLLAWLGSILRLLLCSLANKLLSVFHLAKTIANSRRLSRSNGIRFLDRLERRGTICNRRQLCSALLRQCSRWGRVAWDFGASLRLTQ